jgi:hypothetical protein
MDKDKIETIFRKAGLQPVKREKIGDYDVFYGEGFSRAPHLTWQQHGELRPGDYPMGAHVVFWWIGKDERLLVGHPLFFDWIEHSQAARLNAAREDAMQKIMILDKARPRTFH